MEAVTYPALGEVQKSNIADPVPKADEIVVRVHASGVCHTDIDILHGRYGNSTFPIVPGHEFAGEIVSLGKDVKRFSAGNRVVIDPNFHCGECRPCRKGMTNLCENLGAYGVTRHGGFAELCAIHQDNVVEIGEMPYDIAALAEPVGCVLNGLDAVGTQGVENALIFGAGPIGMLMALSLRTRGVTDVTIVDLNAGRLELAKTFNIKSIPADSPMLKAMQAAVDLVIDATGVVLVAQGLVNYTVNGGRVLFFGVCPPDAAITIYPHDIFRRQIRIAGAHSLNHNIPDALKTIDKIGPDIARLISHRLSLEEVAAFLAKSGARDTLKVQAVMTTGDNHDKALRHAPDIQ